ncbi:hypothetical protein V8F06_010270 [Rhypophila decipiens]
MISGSIYVRTADPKPPIRSIINVLMVAAHYQYHWNLPLTKSFAKENWAGDWRDPSFSGYLTKFASAVQQNWSELTRDLCNTEGEVTDNYAVMFMSEDRSGISGFDFVPFNLLKQGKAPSTTRGRVWSDRHHELYALWVNCRPEQSRRYIEGCDKEDHIKEQHTKDSEQLKSQRERHGHQTRLLQILLDHERQTQSSQGTAIQSSAGQSSQDYRDQPTRMLKVLDKMLDHELKAQKLEHDRETGLEKLRQPQRDKCRNNVQPDAQE